MANISMINDFLVSFVYLAMELGHQFGFQVSSWQFYKKGIYND